MVTETPLQVSLRDPLCEVTRRERRMLLGVSVLSLFVAKTGLIPSKISALGVDFERTDQRAFLVLLALVVTYFIVAFALYGLTDFLAWRLSYNNGSRIAYKETFDRIHCQSPSGAEEQPRFYPDDWIPRWPNHLALPASFARAVFEFLLPVLVGSYAVYALLSAARQCGA
jgi:hypothetical protein